MKQKETSFSGTLQGQKAEIKLRKTRVAVKEIDYLANQIDFDIPAKISHFLCERKIACLYSHSIIDTHWDEGT